MNPSNRMTCPKCQGSGHDFNGYDDVSYCEICGSDGVIRRPDATYNRTHVKEGDAVYSHYHRRVYVVSAVIERHIYVASTDGNYNYPHTPPLDYSNFSILKPR